MLIEYTDSIKQEQMEQLENTEVLLESPLNHPIYLKQLNKDSEQQERHLKKRRKRII